MKREQLLRNISLIVLTSVLFLGSCGKSDDSSYNPSGSKVVTTLDRTLIPLPVSPFPSVSIFDAEKFDQYGYGRYTYGPGVPCQKRLDLMPAGYSGESVKPASTLLHFFTVTDNHITDKESPCQTIFFAPIIGQGGIGCFSPLILYTTHVYDAAVQTINKLDDERQFDLGLALGDMANNTQKNELDWFIKIMDGGVVDPSSGQQKEPVPDYQKSYTAAGLHAHIPWYAALGNHDHFWSGSRPVVEKIRNAYIGTKILQVGNVMTDSAAVGDSLFSMGVVDGSTRYGKVIGRGVVDTMPAIPKISADLNRRTLCDLADWINEFKTSTSQPYGHGFVQSDPNNVLGACYSFVPKSDIPLKIIVLDDTQLNTDPAPPPDFIYGHGELTPDRFHWLISQLAAGQAANQLMIIAAHVPIHVVSSPNPFTWIAQKGCYNTEDDIIDSLQRYPNLILWVSGHRHLNNVTAIPSKTPGQPERGFWEVETKSTREFPEEFRTFDIVRNSDNSISIITTNVDVDMSKSPLAAIGRKYAIASNQIFDISPSLLETGSVAYNAELLKTLTPAMKDKIRNCGKPLTK